MTSLGGAYGIGIRPAVGPPREARAQTDRGRARGAPAAAAAGAFKRPAAPA